VSEFTEVQLRLAQIAYEAYNDHTGGLAFNAQGLAWDEMADRTRDAWAAAVCRVVDVYDNRNVTMPLTIR
jgi:hypothetical protein